VLDRIVSQAVALASHDALLFAFGVVAIGGLLSLLIPTLPMPDTEHEISEDLTAYVPADPREIEIAAREA
jgi:hypothetical protein